LISKKTAQLKNDLEEIKDKFENLEIIIKGIDVNIKGYKELKEMIEMLDEHLKDHIETIENFICDIH
jgi:DNA-binding protein YbaB